MKTNTNRNFILIIILLGFAATSCKKEAALSEYKYSDKGLVINCESADAKLINEALFAFENDISTFYMKGRATKNEALTYSRFIRDAISGTIKYETIATPHTVEIFNVLKTKPDLWDQNNPKSHLNYNSTLFSCIADNLQDQALKATLNALVSTNSMSPKLFGAPLMSKYRSVSTDKYLAAYIAFDLFYAKLFDADLTQVKEREPEKADDNNTPQLPTDNIHDGHDHE